MPQRPSGDLDASRTPSAADPFRARPAHPPASHALEGRVFDVAVVGGGNAGLCAALTAAQAGARVVVLESAPREFRGGNSRHTRNLRCMHDSPTELMAGAYREDEYVADLLQVTGGQTNEELARMTIRDSPGCVDWMRGYGVRFQPALSGTIRS